MISLQRKKFEIPNEFLIGCILLTIAVLLLPVAYGQTLPPSQIPTTGDITSIGSGSVSSTNLDMYSKNVRYYDTNVYTMMYENTANQGRVMSFLKSGTNFNAQIGSQCTGRGNNFEAMGFAKFGTSSQSVLWSHSGTNADFVVCDLQTGGFLIQQRTYNPTLSGSKIHNGAEPIIIHAEGVDNDTAVFYGQWDFGSSRTYTAFTVNKQSNNYVSLVNKLDMFTATTNNQISQKSSDFIPYKANKFAYMHRTGPDTIRPGILSVTNAGAITDLQGSDLTSPGITPLALAPTTGSKILAVTSPGSAATGQGGLFLHVFEVTNTAIIHEKSISMNWFATVPSTDKKATLINLVHLGNNKYVAQYVEKDTNIHVHQGFTFNAATNTYFQGPTVKMSDNVQILEGGLAAGPNDQYFMVELKFDTLTESRWLVNNLMQINLVLHDTAAPTITAPADIAKITKTGHPVVIFDLGRATVSDNQTPTSQIKIKNNNTATSFPIGSYSILWTATDLVGNNATDTQAITITYMAPPHTTSNATAGTLFFQTTTMAATDLKSNNVNTNQTNWHFDVTNKATTGSTNVNCKFTDSKTKAVTWQNNTIAAGNMQTLQDRSDNSVWVTCYQDGEARHSTTLYQPWDTIRAFDQLDDAFGADGLFGVPWVFLVILMVAAVWTGKSAQVGVIFTAAVIAIMVALGVLTLSIEAWAMVVCLAAIGMLLGKKLL